ncbi:MAG: ABC transporter permease [Thermoplasmata archaeon]|nr:MAG: ABC transporter permease [Thermoplasmata archaeon]
MNGLGTGALFFLAIFLSVVGIMLISGLRTPHVFTIALRQLKGHAKPNVALLCAACVGSAVITGSLLSGDSLQSSITDAAYQNLNEVDHIITSDKLFNTSILDRLAANSTLQETVDHLAPALLLDGMVENPDTGAKTRRANLIGFETRFLDFGELMSTEGSRLGVPGENEIYLSEAVSDEVDVKEGDRLNVTFTNAEQLLEAVFLGSQDRTLISVQFSVADVVRGDSLGRFQLNAQRNVPKNVYISLETMQKVLGAESAVNTILISNAGDEREGVKLCGETGFSLEKALDDAIGYRDAGLRLVANREKNYVKLESDDVFLSFEYNELLADSNTVPALDTASPVLTYFWNSLSFENRSVPYSTVCAFDPALDQGFGRFSVNGTGQQVRGELAENELIINNWTAERVGVEVEDVVTINYLVIDEYYTIKDVTRNFTIKYIVDIIDKAEDDMLMPSFPGIEEKESAFDWDPPFPIDLGLISDDDEEYWQSYRGTPKAFISLKTGSDLRKTDIGNLTQVRMLPLPGADLSELIGQLEEILDAYVGAGETSLIMKDIKLDALASASGVELFTQMFLAFSASCILASAVLIMLLITLRVDSRITEIGVLRALGFKKRTINHVLLLEGATVSVLGGFVGAVLGFVFGYFLISGMNTFWSPIVEGAEVQFYFSLDSLVIGFSAGALIAIFTMMVALHFSQKGTVFTSIRHLAPEKKKRTAALPILLLLAGLVILIPLVTGTTRPPDDVGLLIMGLAPLLLIMSVRGFIAMKKEAYHDSLFALVIVMFALLLIVLFSESALIIELFFISGALLLFGFLLLFNHILMKKERTQKKPEQGNGRWLFWFSVRNSARRPKRTMFTVFLFSFTLFVLISLTINLQGALIDVEQAVRESGGGYEIMADGINPVFANLSDPDSRDDSGISSDVFDDLEMEQFKTKGDVGGTCSNLNRAANPRIIGANESFFFSNTFTFVSHEEMNEDDDNPWLLLKEGDEVIPAVGDYNTVVWILGLDLGSTISLQRENGEVVSLKIAGIISNSIFQGSLIIWDRNFDLIYPTNPGYDLFLFKSRTGNLNEQISELESALSPYGLDAYTVESLVIENYLVENTYIFIFQVILVFGLLIGTVGFGIVVSRNALERVREMGILRSMGFSKRMVARSFFFENSYVVLSAMGIGAVSGIAASSVYLIRLQSDVATWPWLHITALLLVSYGVAMLSALLPTRKISRISISDAIMMHE